MKKTKIFAAYLPQFHETEDNNLFWGKGYTDWVGVQNAKPQFKGHIQPAVPLNNNYYDLSDVNTIQWQAKIAKQYGVDGFNIYHYWFKEGKQELEKPAELLLNDKSIDIEFFFSWDNCSWKRTWSNVPGNDWGTMNSNGSNKVDNGLLVELDYGDEEQWKKHFYYLLDFFKDTRYLKIDNKPVFAFMTSIDYERLNKMIAFWNNLAVKAGFSGMYIVSQKNYSKKKVESNVQFYYEPIASSWGFRKLIESKISEKLGIKFQKKNAIKYLYEYDNVWKAIVKREKRANMEIIPGAFVRYDDTPRRGKNAGIIKGATPQKFKTYFSELYKQCCLNDRDFIFITAWNEWGEGAYLEPDVNTKYEYLNAIKEAKQAIQLTTR